MLPDFLEESKYAGKAEELLKKTGIKWGGKFGWSYGKFGGTSITKDDLKKLGIPLTFVKKYFYARVKKDTVMLGYSGVPIQML